MKNDDDWMKKALICAEKAYTQGEVPVGAVIVLEDKLIGEGWNQPISSHDSTAHAEIMALRNAGAKRGNYRLANATMYVTIEPCAMCFGAMTHARIGRLVYGTLEPKSGVIDSNLHLHEEKCFNHKIEITSGVLSAACANIIQQFFKARRMAKKRHDSM
jgi:tRNA(adenine34) deaminase